MVSWRSRKRAARPESRGSGGTLRNREKAVEAAGGARRPVRRLAPGPEYDPSKPWADVPWAFGSSCIDTRTKERNQEKNDDSR
jgi:hypothetical protein